jgi:glycerol-3-phosphate dehydrogenase
VVNATGAWADDLRGQVGGRPRLRKLRGSHLVFPTTRFPLQRAVSLLHPSDARPVFAFPWEGVTIVGTTDVDHAHSLSEEPAISPAEAEYLLDLVRWAFPSLHLSLDDAMATYAGVRPVIDTGKADPSKESREYVLWDESGLLTITGGKLTTFRRMAHSALRAVRRRLPGSPAFDPRQRVLDEPPEERCVPSDLPPAACSRLIGRYGADAPALGACAQAGELEPIGSSSSLWAEVRWASRLEGIVHLDDLLLRRVRIGLTLPQGGAPWMDRIRAIAQPELGWDDPRWESELSRYCTRWQDVHAWPR